MIADYPGAIVVEAANYGYGIPNRPRTWGFHTPEEPADSYPSTPEYLRTTDRDASYTYFVSSWLALVFQLVPESEGAYAHGLEGKPAPPWSDGSNLNLQSLSLSFEGHAATIHQTMPRGCPQWAAGVNLVAHRTKALGLNLDWAFQHKEVSIYRGDCGQFDQAAFIADVRAKMAEEEEDMALTDAEFKRIEDSMERQVKRQADSYFLPKIKRIVQAELAALPPGGGLSAAQTRKAVKDALKEGTG